MKNEAKITQQVRDYLKEIRKKNDGLVYFWKVSDRFTSGIPDWFILINGQCFFVELKKPGKDARRLQNHVLDKIKKAGGASLATDDFSEFKTILNRLLLEKKLKI